MKRTVTLLALGLYAFAIGRDGFDAWVDVTEIPDLRIATSAEVLANDGRPLRMFLVDDGKWRLDADVAGVDPDYLKMLIAYEDQRFYDHTGVDPLAALRAAGQTITAGGVVSGASTLTMQVARLLEGSGTGRLKGKLRQVRLALALERSLTKDQILNLYLKLAPYGGNIEGIRAASYAWFGKGPERLTPAQSALLVALPQSPETRRPDRNVDQAKIARNTVLRRMLQTGILAETTIASAQSEPITNHRFPMPALAPHLADRVAVGDTTTPTTIDYDLQVSLENLVNDSTRDLPQSVSIAVVVADHHTGAIRASIGSARYSSQDGRLGFIDMTQAVRSPGSTLKPFIYGLAFDRGIAHPATLISDEPTRFGTYAPQNFDGTFRGDIRAAEALQLSLNIPAIKLLDKVGPAHLVDVMRKSGADPKGVSKGAGLAVGLGGVGLTLQELVQLYAMLAQGGNARPLSALEPMDLGQGILGNRAAWYVGNTLADLPPPSGMSRNGLAYKTGTSYGHRDAWAIGYDGAHVAGVWIGRPDGTPVPGAFGGDMAAPILFQVFQRFDQFVPLPPAPANAQILDTASLPHPLQRLEQAAPARGPEITFPPNGAEVDVAGGALAVRLKGGTPPYVWLMNGDPVFTGQRRETAFFENIGLGFSEISVIDAKGQSATTSVRLR